MASRVGRPASSWRRVAVGLTAVVVLAGCASASASTDTGTPAGRWDWPGYGHDAQHTFHGRTTLTPSSVATLKTAWFFPTGDAVTATPTVVDGTVYAGSWDDRFYALNLETGAVRWTYRLSAQNAVTPYPGEQPRDTTSDGGLVTSSAWYEPGDGSRPDLVIFGAGYTLYALEAATGALYWRHDYTGRPGRPADPDTDGTRIFSSPVVVGHDVLFATDTDGQQGERGYIAAADLDTGDPVWEFDTDPGPSGRPQADGCGNVWSSGTVLPALGLVVYGTADCNFENTQSLTESVLALHIATGTLAWVYRPDLPDLACDWDFGATANAGVTSAGVATFLGEGNKNGSYYSLDPATGKLRWTTNVVFGGFAGGFVASTAFDGQRVFGATALGDYGNFDNSAPILCDPGNPRDQSLEEPTVHAFDAASGAVAWQQGDAPSFAPTTVAGGMTFNGPALRGDTVQVRSAAIGTLLATVTLPGPVWSGVATVGDALVVGLGSSYSAHPSGIAVVTPGGRPPVVPGQPA